MVLHQFDGFEPFDHFERTRGLAPSTWCERNIRYGDAVADHMYQLENELAGE
jgi:5'-deoxynucleotidase YfbR-like HD superfamily hydrolase